MEQTTSFLLKEDQTGTPREGVPFRDGKRERKMADEDQTTDKKDEPLGEGGYRALVAEREANKELRAQLKELQETVKKHDEEKLSKEEALLKRAEEAEARVKALETADEQRKLRAAVAKDHDVPEDLLNGSNEEELKASAERLKSFLEEATGPRKPDVNPYLGKDSSENTDSETAARAVLGF